MGPPSSGKSTLAAALQQQLPNSIIISTDSIREQLYGEASIQGDWSEIFAQVTKQVQAAIVQGQTILYDATHAKRPWRLSTLHTFLPLAPEQVWIGWHLTTSLETCLKWNRNRHRQVPEAVIETMYAALQTFPPDVAEGMAMIQTIDGSHHTTPEKLTQALTQLLPKLKRRIINHSNATRNQTQTFHPYSDLLAFERLLYVMKLLMTEPGVGSLRHHHPDRLQTLLGESVDLSTLQTDHDEILALLQREHPIYGDPVALAQDLDWLDRHGFLSPEPIAPGWNVPEQPPPLTPCHGYSEIDRFLRLMGILRFILHHPFYEGDGSSLDTLTQALQERHILCGSFSSCRDTLRKDIQLILKPYGFLQSHRHKQGYFLGTGIFSKAQLLQLHQLLAGQARSLADPTVLSLFNTLTDRLKASKLSPLDPYPVRALYNFPIANQNHLPGEALANTISQLEQEIEQGQCLELQRFPGVGRHGTEPDSFIQVWPVQMVFHTIGWYLGYEVASGPQKGLLGFERLDRLFRGRPVGQSRSRTQQEQSVKHLQQLFQASGGLFLGTHPAHQRQWLQGTAAQRLELSVTLELWCNDHIFRFISEGDQRFPTSQLKFSPRLPQSTRPGHPKLFHLPPTGHPTLPHRLQVQLPYWALESVDLKRWILGFEAQVRVIQPQDLVVQFQRDAQAMMVHYGEHEEL